MPVSADTFSVEVARAALAAGAEAVNDISGGSEEMFDLVAESGCGYVLMHIEGPPRVDRPPREYGDVVDHLKAWFGGRVEKAVGLGVSEEQIAIDPGLDFDLTAEQDLEILGRLDELAALGLPLYVSLSRKDFIGAILAGSWEERWPAGEREWGTVAAVSLAVSSGADILRVHDRSARCRQSRSQERSGGGQARTQGVRIVHLFGRPRTPHDNLPIAPGDALGDRDRSSPPRRADRRRERRGGARGAAGRAAADCSTRPSPRRCERPASSSSTRTSSRRWRRPRAPTW